MAIKYKLSELAKDFGMNAKEVGALLTQYGKVNKNGSQTLSDEELNIVFDAISQKNQIKSLADIFKNDFVLFVHRAIHPRGEHLAWAIQETDKDACATKRKRNNIKNCKLSLYILSEFIKFRILNLPREIIVNI